MKNKFVASLMTALMAAVILAAPALAATALNTYPTFLGKSGDFYIVVGAKAATSDVAGAIDIASNLAQLSYRDSTSLSTTSVDGIERKIAISSATVGEQIGGTGPNNLPSTLRNFHYTGLTEGQYEFKGTRYNFHESVVLPTVGTGLILTHTLTSPVNGTLKMRLDQGGVEYRYVFDTAIPAGNIPTGANSTSYSTPLTVKVADKTFQIVAIPSASSFIALVGSVGWIIQGSEVGLVAGDLTAVVDTVYLGTQAAIRIVDSAGNTVTNLGVVGTITQSFTYGGSTYNVKVLQTATITVAGAGENRAQILFGKGNVERTFDGSTASYISDWGANWKIGAANLGTNGGIAANSYIYVRYSPDALTDAERYFAAGNILQGPGGYFELKYAGYYPDKFAKVAIEPSGTVTLYNSTTNTGYDTDAMSGLKFTSDVAGSLVYGSTGYDEMYLLFNESDNGASFSGTHFAIAYKDKTTGRVVQLTTPTDINNLTTYTTWAINFSYGGPGAISTFSIGGMFKDSTLVGSLSINSSTTTMEVILNYINSTVASNSLTPTLKLGVNSGTADANDVRALIEGATEDVSAHMGNLISDGGVQIYSVKSNAESGKVVIGISPEPVYGLVQFGKIGPITSGGTVKEMIPVITAVAKLDSEITATDKTSKNFVLVGGPCANILVQALVDTGKINANYTCTGGTAWKANIGYIIVADDAFATGKFTVVVAGYEAAETRLASTVLQQYATKLASTTANTTTITGTAIATATIS